MEEYTVLLTQVPIKCRLDPRDWGQDVPVLQICWRASAQVQMGGALLRLKKNWIEVELR